MSDYVLQIVDAVKTAENSTSPYIVYVIRTGVSTFLGEPVLTVADTACIIAH